MNVAGDDVPPPGSGVTTVTVAAPGSSTSTRKMCAVRRPALTNFVGRAAPFQRTLDVVTKFAPSTVRMNPVEPALMRAGVRLVSVGTGFALATMTVTAALVPVLPAASTACAVSVCWPGAAMVESQLSV